jgi:hypothetical protein
LEKELVSLGVWKIWKEGQKANKLEEAIRKVKCRIRR